jgi:hypothetical protein
MFDNVREGLAWHRAHTLLKKRKPRAWHSPPSERRVLVVLPAAERHARIAWQFVESLHLDPNRTLPVVPTAEIAFSPISFLGKVKPLDPGDVNRLGLPRSEFLRAVWQFEPEIALCLTSPFDLASAVLVGASPAAFRAGLSDERGEPFFDLIVDEENDYDGALHLLARTLRSVTPVLLASSPAATATTRSVW